MHIRYLNGHRLARALEAGARRLVDKARDLDAINVFPVPDGDTGSNMAATVLTMRHGLLLGSSPSLCLAARAAAAGALDGARGNSGAIVAQFLHGLAVEIGEDSRMGAKAFSAAVGRAVDRTFDAVARPREGTILTVLRVWADRIAAAAERFDDFLPMLREGLEAAKKALARTRETLAEARKAGVVDAGAQGFVHFLEGIMHLVDELHPREALKKQPGPVFDAKPDTGIETAIDSGTGRSDELPPSRDEGPLTFRYCAEARLAGLRVDVDTLKTRLLDLGDSLVLAGGTASLRVHLHTDRPQCLFALLATAGKVMSAKVDDMFIQRALSAKRPRTVVLLDSSCDLPEAERREHLVDRVPVRLEFRGESYIDGEGMDAATLHALLAADPAIPASTSQPLRADFERKFSFLLGVAEEVLYVGPSQALSGTLDAGRMAASALRDGDRIRVVDTGAISIASALLARKAAEAVTGGASAAEAASLVADLRPCLELAVAIPDLERLERSGRLPASARRAAGFLGLRPLIGLDKEGRLARSGLYKAASGPASAVFKAVRKRTAGHLPRSGAKAKGEGLALEVIVAHAGAREEAEKLASLLERHFTLTRPVTIVEAGAALSSHAGAGVVGAAWLVVDHD